MAANISILRPAALALLWCLLLALPSAAPAAETIGQTGVPSNTCAQNAAFAPAGVAGGSSYAAATPVGVITSWRTMGGPAANRTLELLVLHPDPGAGADNYVVVDRDDARAIVAGQLNTFTGINLDIEAGEVIGLWVPPGQPGGLGSCDFPTGLGPDVTKFLTNSGNPPFLVSMAYPDGTSGYRLNASANVEVDADGDGLGDETQDLCTANDATESACVCRGRRATLSGGPGRNGLKGTAKADVITGLEGNDALKGGKGNDIICGGPGRDKLIGGPGKDRLIGGPGKDKQIQ